MGQPTRGVVAAGHPQTAEAGAAMLQQGGNAFDAVVAAALTACVTESALISLGGGGFLLAHTAGGEQRLFDFFSQTPRSCQSSHPLDFYPIQADFGDAVQEFHVGLGSIAVPGVLAGLVQVHRRLGRLPLEAVAEPALHWAIQGTLMQPFPAYLLSILAPILTANPTTRAIYAPNGPLLATGDRLVMSGFAQTLKTLIKTGPEAFYQGDLADQIVHDCQTQGGYLTRADLQHYRVIERSPLTVHYRDTTLLTNPPPSSGGTLIAFALQLLAQVAVGQLQHGSPEHTQLLIEVMRLTNQARRDGYDAQLYTPDIAQRFLADAHLAPYLEQLHSRENKWGSTTHISVLDGEGNAASMTGSNGEGSTYVIPGTDIMLNNMLGEEDLNPEGFHQWRPNQRMSSMMAPTILLRDGRPWLVLGSGGSNRIRTAILQVISNLVDFGLDLEAAIAAPRLHWEQGRFHAEPGYDRQELARHDLEQAYDCIWWQQPNMYFGGVHAVEMDPTGALSGAGDSRRGGSVAWG